MTIAIQAFDIIQDTNNVFKTLCRMSTLDFKKLSMEVDQPEAVRSLELDNATNAAKSCMEFQARKIEAQLFPSSAASLQSKRLL